MDSFGSVEYETRSLGIPIRHEFGEKAYNWEHMLTTYADSTGYTEEEAEAVAALMRDMGYAVRMAGLYLLEFSESGGDRLSYHKILLK